MDAHFVHRLTGVEIAVLDDAVWIHGRRPKGHFGYAPARFVGDAVARSYVKHFSGAPYWEDISGVRSDLREASRGE